MKTRVSSSSEVSEYATRYVAGRRQTVRRLDASWFDVAAAYDAGINHAFAVTPQVRMQMLRYFKALRVINAARHLDKKR